jgi:hypothetical protein
MDCNVSILRVRHFVERRKTNITLLGVSDLRNVGKHLAVDNARRPRRPDFAGFEILRHLIYNGSWDHINLFREY